MIKNLERALFLFISAIILAGFVVQGLISPVQPYTTTSNGEVTTYYPEYKGQENPPAVLEPAQTFINYKK